MVLKRCRIATRLNNLSFVIYTAVDRQYKRHCAFRALIFRPRRNTRSFAYYHFANISKLVKKKPFLRQQERLLHPLRTTEIGRFNYNTSGDATAFYQIYCIIFGQLSQSEHTFDGCYFCTHF